MYANTEFDRSMVYLYRYNDWRLTYVVKANNEIDLLNIIKHVFVGL